jgi:hypothetical protein
MFTNLPPLGRYVAQSAFLILLGAMTAFAQKPTAAVASAPLKLNLTTNTAVVSACSDSGAPQVRLTANAVSPNGNPIKYKWTTSAGTITGEGPEVTWSLAVRRFRLSACWLMPARRFAPFVPRLRSVARPQSQSIGR